MSRRALCVGIDDYPTAPLAGCVNDAEVWKDFLRRNGFDVFSLLNGDATRKAIIKGLKQLIRGSVAGDVLAFQFAGHGTFVTDLDGDEDDGTDEAFCPVDFADGHLLIDDDIGEILKGMKPGVSLTFFCDCCHSGSNTRSILRPSPTVPVGATARFVAPSLDLLEEHKSFRESLKKPGRRSIASVASMTEILFSACLPNEVAWESNGQGAFTVAAMAALRDGIGGMTNTQFINEVLIQMGPGRRQTPKLYCNANNSDDILLSPKQAHTAEPAATHPAQLSQEMTDAEAFQFLADFLKRRI